MSLPASMLYDRINYLFHYEDQVKNIICHIKTNLFQPPHLCAQFPKLPILLPFCLVSSNGVSDKHLLLNIPLPSQTPSLQNWNASSIICLYWSPCALCTQDQNLWTAAPIWLRIHSVCPSGPNPEGIKGRPVITVPQFPATAYGRRMEPYIALA